MKSAIIASDDKNHVNNVTKSLVENDFSVITSKSSLNAVLRIITNNVHILLIDANTDVEEKIEAIEIIKKLRPRLPIVVFIKNNRLEIIRELVEAGAFYVAIKPVEKNTLHEIIHAVDNYYEIKKKIGKLGYQKS